MNYKLSHVPERTDQPRDEGLTMVMDKGLCIRQAEDLLDGAGHLVDIVKLGFGTSFVTPRLKEKIALYQKAGMRVYLGGTLFEAFIARGMFEDFLRVLDKYGLDCAEVSDGSISLEHDEKCAYISRLAQDITVLSEVGSKESGILISPAKWVRMMNTELEAGSWKVIAEARESGNVGIYRPSGHAHTALVSRIVAKVPQRHILWEAPIKSQQIWFLKQFGANVNLGNIAPEEVIPLETLRLGLRGDTFFQYLPEEVAKGLRQEPPAPKQTKPKVKSVPKPRAKTRA